MTLPKARLSKDGRWAIRSTDNCGTRFAEIVRDAEANMADFVASFKAAFAGADYRRPGASAPVDWLTFGPGWYRDRDGAWRMDGRAWKNLSKGRGPKMRRAPNPDSGLRFDASGNVTSTRGRERGYRPDSHLNRTSADEFPMEIVCPACGRHQLATQDGFTAS